MLYDSTSPAVRESQTLETGDCCYDSTSPAVRESQTLETGDRICVVHHPPAVYAALSPVLLPDLMHKLMNCKHNDKSR